MGLITSRGLHYANYLVLEIIRPDLPIEDVSTSLDILHPITFVLSTP